MSDEEEVVSIRPLDHHLRQTICETRSKYRCGRRATAVKVFTISDESNYLLIHNIPDIKSDVKQELRQLCQRFGPIDRLVLTDYQKRQQFSNVFLIKYKHFVNAVTAKKSLDDHNFLGSILHVCYAPELETIDETMEKLDQRRRYVFNVLSKKQNDSKEEPIVCPKIFTETEVQISIEKSLNKRKHLEISDKSTESETKSTERPKSPKLPKTVPKIRWSSRLK